MTNNKLKSTQELWNENVQSIPVDRDPSNYAIEKEKLFSRHSFICDLGGSSGAESLYFIQKGHEVTILDISNIALERACTKAESLGFGDKLKTVQFDMSKGKLPLIGDLFDVVYSRLALHYFTYKRTIELLKEIYRVLKKGGTAYLTLKSPEDKKEMRFLKSTAKEIESEVFDDKGQIKSRFSKSTLVTILNSTKIKKFEVKNYTENLSGRVDRVKSGAKHLLLTEIIIKK